MGDIYWEGMIIALSMPKKSLMRSFEYGTWIPFSTKSYFAGHKRLAFL
jgi:hypothetical protein